MKVPKAFMRDLQVDFVSLVNKGANKQRFAIYKSAEGIAVEAKEAIAKAAETVKVPVNKYGEMEVFYDDYGNPIPIGSSFKEVLQARDTQAQIDQSRWAMEDYFHILKCVLRGVVQDTTQVDKSAAMKKAIDEFKSATVTLFKGLPVEKAAELLNVGGEGMRNSGNQSNAAAPSEVNKANGSGGSVAGISSNPQSEAQNRTSDAQPVVGITKEEAVKLNKADATEMLKKVQSDIEKAGEVAKILQEVLKTGTDQDLGTGRDTVASNGATGTVAPDHAASAAATTPATENVNKAAGSANDAAIGADASATPGPGPAKSGEVNMMGQIQKMFETFATTMTVAMDGKISGAVALLKEDVNKAIESKLNPLAANVQKLEKSAGLSNSDPFDFDTEGEKKRLTVTKSDDQEWAKVTGNLGSLSRSAKR